MALKNITGKLLGAWFDMLDGNVGVPVYRSDAASDAPDVYVVIRPESETSDSNNQKHVTLPVIITEVVAKFSNAIDDEIVCAIDDFIASLLFPEGPAVHGLPMQDDIQIISVYRQNSTHLQEDDGTNRFHRLVTRNVHRIVQLAEAS